MTRRVTLRDERDGLDRRHLEAYLDTNGSLHIDGQDLGPGTGTVSGDGEYEWFETIAARDLPRLAALLGALPDEGILELLERKYRGKGSYEFQRVLRDSDIEVDLHVF